MDKERGTAPAFGRIVGGNLAALLVAAVLFRFVPHALPGDRAGADLLGVFLFALWICGHFVYAAIKGLERPYPAKQAWAVSALLVLLIGFGTCIKAF